MCFDNYEGLEFDCDVCLDKLENKEFVYCDGNLICNQCLTDMKDL